MAIIYKFGLNALAVLLIPFLAAGAFELVSVIAMINVMHNIYFLLGGACFLFVHFYFYSFVKIFIYQHELTHGFFALLSGGDIRKIKVGKDGGSVSVTKPNVIVALAPYIFPFFPVILIFAYYLFVAYSPQLFSGYRSMFDFLFGFTIFFHFLFTYISLRNEQSDLKKNGYLTSMTAIIAVNLEVIALVMKTVNPANVNLCGFFGAWGKGGIFFYSIVWDFVYNSLFARKTIV